MKKKNIIKYSIMGLSLVIVIVIAFVVYSSSQSKKIKTQSEWFLESYDLWVENRSYLYLDKEAAYEFYEYLKDEKKVSNANLNFAYQGDKAIFLFSDDGKNYVAYEILFDNHKLDGEVRYLGSNKNVSKLLDKNSIDKDEDLFYGVNTDGTFNTDTYEVVFKNHYGEIIKQTDEFEKNVNVLTINSGKSLSMNYIYNNYIIDNGKTYGYVFKGWECDGDIYQSPFNITKDMTFTAVVEQKEGLVNNGYNVFNTLEEAFANSKQGDTLVLMKDLTVDKLTIPEGIKLLIPSDNRNTSLQIPGDINSLKTPVSDKPFVTLTVNELTVDGELNISSVIGYPGSGGAYQGHTSGSHGLLVVNNVLNVNGTVDASGYIKGTGKAYIHGTLNCPFIVRDFRGGTNTLGVYTNGSISPFNVYELRNVQIETTYYSDATLAVYGNLYAGGQYNIAKSPVIGKDGVVVLDEGSTAVLTYDESTERGCITINGGASDGFFSLTVMGATVTIAGVFFPLPYCFDVVLENGEYNLNTSYKLLPGSKFIIKKDAVCNINNEFIVYSQFIDTAYAGSCYPELDASIFEVSGVLNINRAFGGLITLVSGGTINVGKKYTDETGLDKDVLLELTSKEGHSTSTDTEGLVITNEITEKARIEIDGEIIYLVVGSTYK